MRIVWRLPIALAADAEGRRSITQDLPAEITSVGEALTALQTSYPKLVERILDDRGVVREHVNVFVQDTSIKRARGLQTPLTSGDVVTILHAVSGGSPTKGYGQEKARQFFI